ncbi:MAG: vWA domain-containing protein, partial [Nannocystaceae bacterium]
ASTTLPTDGTSPTDTDPTTGSQTDSDSTNGTNTGSMSDSMMVETETTETSETDATETDATTVGPTQTNTETDATSDSDSDSDSDSTTGKPDTDSETESDSDFCLDEEVEFEQAIPTVVLLIDQSGSMNNNFNGQQRWQAVDEALFDPQNGVVSQLDSVVRFGLSLYTSVNGFENGGECPLMEEVPPMLDNAMAMKMLFDANDPVEDTPTGEAIDVVVPTLIDDLNDGPAVIVLATDGEPDTCDVPDPQTGQDASVAAAEAAYNAGIPVYIISVGNDVSDAHLQDMANAGAGVMGNDPDAPFYKANDQQALFDAFDEIINGVRDCKLSLDGKITEGEEDTCSIDINGEPVPYNEPDGWQVNDPSEIELLGKACQSIQQGDVEVDIKCPCGVIVPE